MSYLGVWSFVCKVGRIIWGCSGSVTTGAAIVSGQSLYMELSPGAHEVIFSFYLAAYHVAHGSYSVVFSSRIRVRAIV